MAGRCKKRFWSDDEKRSICLQVATTGVSVAQVARRYAMNANLIFKWLKNPRFAPKFIDAEAEPAFLPVGERNFDWVKFGTVGREEGNRV